MKDINFVLPQNGDALGVLGYLIIVNRQVHSYQVEVLHQYFTNCNSNIEETCLPAILDGRENAVSFENSLNAYSTEALSVQECLYFVLVILANVDDCCDEEESHILEVIKNNSKITNERCLELDSVAHQAALSMRSENNILFAKPYHDPVPQKTLLQKIVDWLRRFFYKLFHLNKNIKTENASAKDTDYKSAIVKCAEIAKDDFSVIQPVYSYLISKCDQVINELSFLKRNLISSTKLSAEVAKSISTFSDCLSENVLNQSKEAQAALLQKERTLPDFTISLLGRTKAGKSTLHSILTGQERDKIGAGMQRTTRYNRVYQWNLLRIIDTPGIGSAEADGRSDDEIAASVLEESDIICFVVVDDSILRDVLEFIERIALLNKPIIILLNHKENIRPEIKFKRYISNPTDWLTTKGEANLQGHINRIYKYAQEHNFDSLLSVFPVFLLSALMAQEEEYKEYSNVLWESSNLDAFIDDLKRWITISGPLKRSQTLLDGAIQTFSKAERCITLGSTPVKEKVQDLKKRKPIIVQSMIKEQDILLNSLREYLTDKFNTLEHQDAISFAEEYYDYDGDLTPKWEMFLESRGFNSDIKTEVERLVGCFSSKIDDTVQEVFEDFYFSFQMSSSKIGVGDSGSFDFRSFTKVLGGLIDIAGSIVLMLSNPVGWVLAIAGIVLNFISGLFKSKAQKRQKAIEKISSNLSHNIHEESPKHIAQVIAEIKKKTNDVIGNVDLLFDSMIEGLEKTLSISDELAKEYKCKIDLLNRIYAWRILTFLLGKMEFYHQDKVNELVFSVERNSKHIRIQTPKDIKFQPDALKNVIAEEIEIVKTEDKICE